MTFNLALTLSLMVQPIDRFPLLFALIQSPIPAIDRVASVLLHCHCWQPPCKRHTRSQPKRFRLIVGSDNFFADFDEFVHDFGGGQDFVVVFFNRRFQQSHQGFALRLILFSSDFQLVIEKVFLALRARNSYAPSFSIRAKIPLKEWKYPAF